MCYTTVNIVGGGSAENTQLLQKIRNYCRKCAAIAENLQVLQKICSFCRKSAGIAENMQLLQKICRCCRKYAAIAENMQKICRYCRKCADFLQIFCNTCRSSVIPFTSSKYHRVVLVPRHVSTREIRKEYFQERSLCHSLQKSTRSIRDEEFTASSFSHLLARHDGRVSKSDRTTIRVHGPGFTSCQ